MTNARGCRNARRTRMSCRIMSESRTNIPLPLREREGPVAKQREGEVSLRGMIVSAINTHLIRSLRSHLLPPQAGGEGCEWRVES
jgi:hypothetical protein